MVKTKQERRSEKPEAAVRLGKRIRELRVERKLSQAKIAEQVDMSSKYLGEVERGESNISFELLGKIATTLDVSIQAIVDTDHKRTREDLVDEVIRMAPKLSGKDAEIAFRMMKVLTDS